MLIFRILGVLLLLPAFIPLESFFGPIVDARGMMGPEAWGLGLLLLLAFAFILGKIAPRLEEKSRGIVSALPESVFCIVLPLIQFFLAAFICQRAFSAKPLIVDEIVQLFQAKIFASGQITAALPKLPQFFVNQHIVFDGARWYGQYPPGHSALLALFSLFLPVWLLSPFLSALTVFALYKFAKEAFSVETARLTALLLIATPFFLFMSASFMNHVPLLLFESIALWQFARWERTRQLPPLIFLALSLGAAFLIRPLCTIAIGAVLAIWSVQYIREKKKLVQMISAAFVFAAVASLQLLFNHSTTGDYFLPGYIKLWGKAHDLGFHMSPWGEAFTPYRGFINQVINLSFLNEYAFEWPVPSFFFISLLLVMLPSELGRWEKRLIALLLAFPGAYLFYWHRDSYLGPRFLYGSLPAMVPLTIQAWKKLSLKLPNFPTATFYVLVIYSLLLGIPQRFEIYRTSLASMKFDLRPILAQQKIEKALVFIPVSWGSRIIARLRGMGYSAQTVEIAYRTSDHCALQEFIEHGGTTADLQALSSDRVEKMRITLDPTLRLDPNRVLTERCQEEIRYDLSQPFTVYAPYFLLNDPDLNGPLIVATDLRGENEKLMAQYADRPAYILRGDKLEHFSM